jgi:hypothetical protein
VLTRADSKDGEASVDFESVAREGVAGGEAVRVRCLDCGTDHSLAVATLELSTASYILRTTEISDKIRNIS